MGAGRMQSALRQIVEVVGDTARSVQEQAVVSDEIARNMDAVQKIANEVLVSSEEAVVQGEQLHHLAHQLEESVRSFNLESAAEGGGLPAARTRARPRIEGQAADKRAGERRLPPGRGNGPAAKAEVERRAAAAGGKPPVRDNE